MSHRGQLQCLNNATTVSFHSHTMTPQSSHSPVNKMAQPQRTSSQDSTSDGIRKRVCKACDRCRLKKSKCDGSNPCSRCKADNAICVFGERKKSHDKVYPKGYVEMLEQQQAQLVEGLQEMYKRLRDADQWKHPLNEPNGHPLTHDILEALGLLQQRADGSGEIEHFEEDPQQLQDRLISNGAGFTQRRGSFSSESEHSQHGHARSMSHGTPSLSKPQTVKQESIYWSRAASPSQDSPASAPRQRQSFPTSQPSPLQHASPLSSDPQFYQADWAYPSVNKTEVLMRSNYAMESPDLGQNLHMGTMNAYGQWDNTNASSFDVDMTALSTSAYSGLPSAWANVPRAHQMDLDPMEGAFDQFIQVIS